MKSYVKIYGPPVLKALRTLEKIAVNTPQVCIMDTLIEQKLPSMYDRARDHDIVNDYFTSIPTRISRERCDTIVSRSGESIGQYDFYFEWFTEPNMEQLNDLIKKIDQALEPLGCKYTITTER
jgi:hypothetical protein